MNLSEHFTLAELTRTNTGLPNQPSELVLERLRFLCVRLEQIRSILRFPIVISSGYRSEAVNVAIGGSKTSSHMLGWAADFTCPGFGNTPQIVAELRPHLKSLGCDQLILEKPDQGGWVHFGIRPHDDLRYQCLLFDGNTYTTLV